jgi:hypothetical protein
MGSEFHSFCFFCLLFIMTSVKTEKFTISGKVKIMQEQILTFPELKWHHCLSCIMKSKDSILIAELETGGGACKCMDIKTPPHNKLEKF